MTAKALPIPEVGQAVRVRSRLATVRAVEPYDSRSAQGRLHVVDVEYLDDYRYPETEQLLWEVEATASILGSTSLPGVDANVHTSTCRAYTATEMDKIVSKVHPA
jgi:hypothetical protein